MSSFKKIALGLVAAMTMGTIVATPASAAVMTVAAYGASAHGGAAIAASGAGSGDSAANAIQIPVPSSNVVDDTKSVKFVATVDTGTTVSVAATNASIVTALNTAAAPVTASAGSASYSVNVGTGTQATFYVFIKTTAIGSVTITNQGTTRTFYVQGTSTGVNSISVVGSDVAAAGTQATYTVTALDVFGNKLPSVPLTATVANGTLASATATTEASVLATYGTADFKVTLGTAGSTTVIFGLGAAAVLQAEVAGFNTRTLTAAKVVSIRDLAAELAAANAALAAERAGRAADKVASDTATATAKAAADAAALKAAADLATANAEIAKLKADAVIAKAAADKALADAVAAHATELAKVKADNAAAVAAMKKAFNALAKKWNAKNPKAKVALVK
jgi:hypothetical protein